MRYIFSRIRLSGKQLALFLLFTLSASAFTMLLPTVLAGMIDKGVARSDFRIVLVFAALMAMITLFTCVANIAATTLSAKISTKFAADIRKALFDKVQSFSATEMEHFGTASLVTRSTSDVTNVQMFLTLLLRLGVMAPLMAAAGLVLSSLTGGGLSSVLLVAIPLLILCATGIIIFVSHYSKLLREKIDLINRLFLETMEGVRVIRAFNRQQQEAARFGKANQEYADLTVISGRITGLMGPVIQIIFGATTAAVMAIGSQYVSSGQIEVGVLVANSQYISMILGSVMLLSLVIMMFPMAFTCAKRISEVLQTTPSITDGTHEAPERRERGTVVFDHVTFSYPDAEEPLLKDISFETHPGEITAIIGRTGCGKSTVLKLIPRLYDPLEGHVYVDGIDIRQYQLDALRKLVGYIPQKNYLFSGDVAYNLNFGKEDGNEADWAEAAEISCAKEFIENRDGTYHAEIAQGGTNLSGGQRQRMAIARAVMKKPEIYLFDDSFSALDMKTDRELRKRLKNSLKDSTMIIVAQRISSILDADQILVMENGSIVGRGTHRELLQNCRLYREIAELQLGMEEIRNEIQHP